MSAAPTASTTAPTTASTTASSLCANASHGSNCPNAAKLVCKGCLLVCYCSLDCLQQDRASHKKWCKSPLMNKKWRPQWAVENRDPRFGTADITNLGGSKVLWGKIPAFDCLKLEGNEGHQWGQDLYLLFASSGDPRAVIQTINATPKDFRHGTHIVMSDGDVAIVARNALILLSAFLIDDAAEAANTIIHLWYSSRLKKSHMQALEALVLPLIQAVCDKIVKKPADSLLGKTWTFQTGGSLRLVLCKENWTQLLDCLRVPDGLTAQRADQARQSVTLSPSNVDHRELKYLAMTREHRVADQKFRTDGILLPFGESRVDFTIPNPTMYNEQGQWMLKEPANPLHGWLPADLSRHSDQALADQHGMMYRFLEQLLGTFHNRLRTGRVTMELLNMVVKDLSGHLEGGRFARVEVSISKESKFFGCPDEFRYLGPLLQPSSLNPHATLIVVLGHAVEKVWNDADMAYEMLTTSDMRMGYLGMKIADCKAKYDPHTAVLCQAAYLTQPLDKHFERYTEACDLKRAGQMFGVEMKTQHTIVDKWPFALKLKYGSPGAQEEFDTLFESGQVGAERFTEWKRIP